MKLEMRGLKELQADVDDLIRSRVPKITAMTLTEVGKGFKAEVERRLPEVFDRPTPWTMRSLYLKPATPQELSARVWFKDEAGKGGTPASKYLLSQVEGGERRHKAFEKALIRFGVMASNEYAVPGAGAQIDQHGNMSHAQITQILAGVGALQGMSDYNFRGKRGGYTRRANTINFFAVRQKKHGGLVPGIWERLPDGSAALSSRDARRLKKQGAGAKQYGAGAGKFYSVVQGRRVRPIVIFVKRPPQYKKRLPFYDWGQTYINDNLAPVFRRIAAETLAYWQNKGGK